MTKELDPHMAAAIAKKRELSNDSGAVMTSLAENRGSHGEAAKFWAEGAPEIKHVENFDVPGPAGPHPARLFRVETETVKPAVIFLHGGGWARGSIDNTEWTCRALAAGSGLPILSLSYRLAPENPFPAAIDDISAAMDWCAKDSKKYGLDGQHIILAGASGGANLALTTALFRRDTNKSLPIGLCLLYGMFGDKFDTESYKLYGNGQYAHTTERIQQYHEWYIPKGERSDNPLINPIHADMTGMPPAWIANAEFDVLRDDSFMIADLFKAANVPVTLKYYETLSHSFASLARMIPLAQESLSDAAQFLRTCANKRGGS